MCIRDSLTGVPDPKKCPWKGFNTGLAGLRRLWLLRLNFLSLHNRDLFLLTWKRRSRSWVIAGMGHVYGHSSELNSLAHEWIQTAGDSWACGANAIVQRVTCCYCVVRTDVMALYRNTPCYLAKIRAHVDLNTSDMTQRRRYTPAEDPCSPFWCGYCYWVDNFIIRKRRYWRITVDDRH